MENKEIIEFEIDSPECKFYNKFYDCVYKRTLDALILRGVADAADSAAKQADKYLLNLMSDVFKKSKPYSTADMGRLLDINNLKALYNKRSRYTFPEGTDTTEYHAKQADILQQIKDKERGL